jgi:hypothetical protein
MNDIKSTSNNKNKNINNEDHKEINQINNNKEQINLKPLQKQNNIQYDKNTKAFFINNQNNIDSINIINNNTNYKNIILNNMLTPNKKFLTNEKSSRNKKNIKIERNILFNNNQGNKNFRTLGQNKQKSLNKNSALKLILNNQEKENPTDIEMKYKLIVYEKNNLINKLKSEVEYYKNYYHNINMNMNIILPNNNSNTIEENSTNRVSLGLNDKKNTDGENIRNRIKNIFSLPKKEIKFDNNHLLKHNINDYNSIKTFMNKMNSDNINYKNFEAAKELKIQIKNNFNTIENNSSKTKKLSNNKLLLSNDSLKNDILINPKNIENNTKTLNNMFYRSNSNTIQTNGRKLKLGFQPTELTLDMNNNKYNSIEANRNYKNNIKNKKHIIYSLNLLNSKTGSENELDNNNINGKGIHFEDNSFKNKHFFNNISSSPSSIYKDIRNKNIVDDNNSLSLVERNSNIFKFNYKEHFEGLKKRMNNLVNNLFDLIEKTNNNK